jgi:hypothetical protein
LRCAPEEIERVAGDERKRGYGLWPQHFHLARRDNLDLIHNVSVRSLQRPQLDGVTDAYIFKSAKKSVPMASDADVAGLARAGCTRNPSDRVVQSQIVGAVEERGFKRNLRNPQHRQWSSRMFANVLSVGLDPLFAPKPEVDTRQFELLGGTVFQIRAEIVQITLSAWLGQRLVCSKVLECRARRKPAFRAGCTVKADQSQP